MLKSVNMQILAFVISIISIVFLPSNSYAVGKYGLGRVALDEEISAWDTDVRPDGQGLPEGEGTVIQGEGLFADKCASCHGDFGEGTDRWPVLAGGRGTLKSEDPVKTVGSYWPYLSTVFDYVHRAMPYGNARSLSNDELYSITAYILYLNDLVDDEMVLNKDNFTSIRLPNEDNFIPDDRPDTLIKSASVCMNNCKDSVEIIGHARVIDVTPDDGRNKKPIMPALSVAHGTNDTADTVVVADATGGEAVSNAASADMGGDVDNGKKIFKKCAACHATVAGKKKIGPTMFDIYGKKAASMEGYKYSKAMKNADLTWDKETLDAFLEKPRKYLKGTRMSFAGLKKQKDRDDVIAYIMSLKP